jgi:hypothetical protein
MPADELAALLEERAQRTAYKPPARLLAAAD